MLILECLVGLHRTIQLQLLSITGWGIDLDNCDTEWFALETNRDHRVIFEIASSGPHSVIPLYHDPAIFGGPTSHGLVSLS